MFSRVTNEVSPSDSSTDESGFGDHKENSIRLTALSQVWWKDDCGVGSFLGVQAQPLGSRGRNS